MEMTSKMTKNTGKVIVLALLMVFTLLSGCTNNGGTDGKQNAVTAPADSNVGNMGPKETASETVKTTAADPSNGKTIYAANCMPCHGDGNGGHNGPSLTDSKITKDPSAVANKVTEGGKVMPSFKGTLSDQQIQDVAAYISQVIAKN
jgi:mono/diheme cytochrome c family protein